MNVVWERQRPDLWFIAPIEATHQICRVAPSVGEVEVVTRGDHDINAFTMASGADRRRDVHDLDGHGVLRR